MSKSTAASVTQSSSIFDMPMRKGLGVDIVRVTPEIAQHWLDLNTANRKITQAKIDQYQADMEAGYWFENGETISFAYGKLLDGQHRLMALILAGVTIRMIVVHGIDPEAQATMDTGRSRTPRDIISIEREGHDGKWESATLGSAIHTVIAYDAGLATYSAKKYTNREVRNYYLEHASAMESTIRRVAGYPRRHPLLPHARTVALHYILSRSDADAANTFFDRLLTGENLTKNSPIYQLRSRLDLDRMDNKTRTAYEQFYYVVKAWNCYRKGGSLKSTNSLYPRQGDPFPEIAP